MKYIYKGKNCYCQYFWSKLHMIAGVTKMSNVVRNVLGPSEELRLVELLRKTQFSLYVDETSVPNGSVKWMSFLVSFVDSETLDVHDGINEINSSRLNKVKWRRYL